MRYTYVLKIAYVSRLKTKVDSQGFMPSRWIRIELTLFVVINKKTFVLSVVLHIMVDKGSLLNCVVVVVVIRK